MLVELRFGRSSLALHLAGGPRPLVGKPWSSTACAQAHSALCLAMTGIRIGPPSNNVDICENLKECRAFFDRLTLHLDAADEAFDSFLGRSTQKCTPLVEEFEENA